LVQDWLGPAVGTVVAAGFFVNAIRDWRNEDVSAYRMVGSAGAAFACAMLGIEMRGELVTPIVVGVIMVPIAVIPTRTAVRLFAPRKALEQLAREGETWALPDATPPSEPTRLGEAPASEQHHDT